MIYININNVEQGAKLGKHIFAQDGRILLNEGVILTIGLLDKLRQIGVSSLYIQDERFSDIEIEEVISETTRRKAIMTLADSIKIVQNDGKLNGKEISKVVFQLIEETMINSDVLIHLTDIRTKDNELFVHSVNVCIVSVMVGVQIGLTKDKIVDLAVGALLHDIGKLLEDGKEKELPSEFKGNKHLLKHHAWKGFNFLRKNKEISTLSAHIALTHHEHIDGSGQPRGMKDDDIHFLTKIVTICNDFDRLLSASGSHEALPPHEACERLMANTNHFYDHKVMWKFLRCVAFYPTGSQVKLSNGSVGIVTAQHKGLPQRPIVRTFTMKDDIYSYEEVDLAKEKTVFISQVLS